MSKDTLPNGAQPVDEDDGEELKETSGPMFPEWIAGEHEQFPWGWDYVPASGGALKYTNKKIMKRQRGVLLDLLKNLGSSLVEGRGLMGVSLPVTVFEPRSMLERMIDKWLYAPVFLPRAAEAGARGDFLERFKLTLTFLLSGLHCSTSQLKPFNPIIGETFQARLTDGTEAFCEQTSHHPPVSAFDMRAPDDCWRLNGHTEYVANTGANTVKGLQHGPTWIEFPGQPGRIFADYPTVLVKGTLFGERTLNYVNKLVVSDAENNIHCELLFNPDEKSGLSGLFSRQATPEDTVRGDIYRIISGDGKRSKDREAICVAEGSWMHGLSIGGQSYWQLNREKPAKLVRPDSVLPSDSRNREDMIALRAGNVPLAQSNKEAMENVQRHDRKLRHAQHGHGHGHRRSTVGRSSVSA